MKRSLLLALVLIASTNAQASARGFGGFAGIDGAAGYGIRGAGGLDANGIQGAGGLWGAGIHGAGGLGGEGVGMYGGFNNPNRGGGFGNPSFSRGGGSHLNPPTSVQPPANFGRQRTSLRGASTMGLQTGGFRAGQFGPMIGSSQNSSALSTTRAQTAQTAPGSNTAFGLPTDMGINSSRNAGSNVGLTGNARALGGQRNSRRSARCCGPTAPTSWPAFKLRRPQRFCFRIA